MKAFPIHLAALTFWAAANLCAANITIVNPSFEVDVFSQGGYFNAPPSGWTDVQANGLVGPWFPAAGFFNTPAPDGDNILFVGYGSPGEASQNLSALLQADTTYTLSFYVGARLDLPFSPYTVSLTANGVTLASDSGGNPTSGNFVARSFSFTTGANPAGEGTALGIDVYASGLGSSQADFDAFSLTADPASQSGAPEPATLPLMGGALALAAAWSRRRRQSRI
jgi:hypothetical protein